MKQSACELFETNEYATAPGVFGGMSRWFSKLDVLRLALEQVLKVGLHNIRVQTLGSQRALGWVPFPFVSWGLEVV